MRREDAGHALETEDGAVDIRLLQQHTGVVGQIARRKIIRAIHDDVVRADEVERVFGRDARVVDNNFTMRIDAANGFPGRFSLGATHVGIRVENLALQIGIIHGVEIHDADLADAGGGEIHRDGRAKATRADAQNARGFDFLLPGQTDFGQNQMPRIPANLFIVQFHNESNKVEQKNDKSSRAIRLSQNKNPHLFPSEGLIIGQRQPAAYFFP